MNYLLSQIATIVDGKLIGSDAEIKYILTDSRQSADFSVDYTIFIALNSARRKGTEYIPELKDEGFRYFICDHQILHTKPSSYILVNDSLEALQKLAAHHRNQFFLPVIGITGSNGKTIVKDWMSQLLTKEFEVVKSPGSYNSQLGVPLSVLQIEKKHQMGIFEAGISHTDEMRKLQPMIKPDMVILTHFGTAHDEGFESSEQKIREKLILAKYADCLVYCKDNELVDKAVKEFISDHYIKTISYSFKNPASVLVQKIDKKDDRSTIHFIYKSAALQFSIPYIDEASIENALSCLCALIALERLDESILKSFERLQPVAGRLEQKKAINNCILINDSYNSDLHSLQAALNFLDRQNPLLKKTVILSDMFQSGMIEDELYQKIFQLLNAHHIYKLIGIGSGMLKHYELFSSIAEVNMFEDTHQFLQRMNSRDFNSESILLKGSRVFEFEKIAALLEKQSHQTKLEINLDAIHHNLKIYKQLLSKDMKLMVMVKAFSYGSGSYELAKFLQHQRVDYLAVAYADEGVSLRDAGITVPVMVMNSSAGVFKLMKDYDLEPTIFSIELLESANKYTLEYGHPMPIHLEFETGMNRLGIEEQHLERVLELLTLNPLLQVKSIFTHLASSEDINDDIYTKQQLDQFKRISHKIQQELGGRILMHIANTAGISRFNGFNLSMARLGLGLHGIDPANHIQSELKPVSKLKTIISQIRRVKKGESIGYNRKTIADKDFNMGVIAIGYADGLNRKLSCGRGGVYIQGEFCKIVGSVCMDMCMIDLGDLNVNVGDEVVIFENAEQLRQMAQACDTITYEILTGLSERITRIYIQE